MRCAFTVAYDGTSYLGSQIQKESKNTIFGEFEKVLHLLGIKQRVIVSGRTDKGVHATGQVCDLSLPPFWSDLARLKRVINTMLPDTIVVKKIEVVGENFHSRYSAKRRVYRYFLQEGEIDPFLSRFVSYEQKIDFKKLQNNISLFVGEHDFQYFMKQGSDVHSTTRTIYRAFAYKHKGVIVLYFEANGFLRSQIRLMVGALLTIDADKILKQLNVEKKYKIQPAKSNGLYLAKIKY